MNKKSRMIYRLSIVLALVIVVLLSVATAIEESNSTISNDNSSHSKVNKTQGLLWTKVLKEKRAGKLNVTAHSIEPLSLPVTKTRVLLNLKLDLLNDTQRESALATLEGYGASNISVYKYVNVTAADFPIDKFDELASLEYVEGILDAEEKIFEPKLDNSIPAIKANYTYSLGMNGSGVRVAVIDTGIDHDTNLIKIARDNAGQLLQYNALNGTTTNASTEDNSSHGTHVAGIIAAQRHQYGGRWLQGVAPGAEIVPVKVFDKNDSRSGTPEPIVRGIDWAIGQNVDIIHMSLGTILPENYRNYWVDTWPATDHLDEMAAVRNAVDRGIAVVISSGNAAANHASGQLNNGHSREIQILPTQGNVTVRFYTQTREGNFAISVKNATGTEVLQSNYLNDDYLIRFDIWTAPSKWTLS